MSLWRPERLGVGVGLRSVSVRQSAFDLHQNLPLDLSPSASPAECSQRLTEALTALVKALAPGAGASRHTLPQVLVADGVARYWMMSPPSGLRSLAELKAVAQTHCEQLFGGTQRWQLAGDWSARRRFFCAAIPEWVVTGVRAGLGRRATLGATLPSLLVRSALSFPSDGWACVLLPGRIHLLSTAGGRIHSVRSLSALPASDLPVLLTAAAQELQRESLRHGIAIGGSVPCLCAASSSLELVDAAGIGFICQPVAAKSPSRSDLDPMTEDAALAAMLALSA